ncbi:hypothetical protein AB45_5157 [Escherichia coli 3-105-05_S1_C2]|nr:hypothetical protein AB45_5157 [Escherichia coli 3-105-05_S1_C2]
MCISSPEENSWSVIYRKNSGEDINIICKRKANAVCNTCSLQTKLELLLN